MIEILYLTRHRVSQRLKGKKFAMAAVALLLALQFVGAATAANTAAPGPATSVVLTLIPPKLPADGGYYPAAIVSLVDTDQNPTAALSPITVFLTSSQPNIASVPDSIVIGAGQEYGIANVTTTTTPGTALITAHAEGYGAPSDVLLTTATPSGFPSRLVVLASPSQFLARSDTGVFRVEVVDAAGQPSKAISPIPISLTSSNISIAKTVQSSITIPTGTIFASGTFITTNSGTAVITAISTGYSSGLTSVVVNQPCATQCGPAKLALTLVPGVLPADGASYEALQIGLETQSGGPAVAGSDTIVQLTSDAPAVASIDNLVAIPAGQISVLTNVTTSVLAAGANFTASAAGLITATTTVHTIIPAPSKLQAYVAPPSSAYSGNGNYPILVVQLQDSNGNPARARQETNLVVTSSNGTLIGSFVTLSIPKGNDYAFTYLNTEGVGQSVLKVSSQGLVSSTVNLVSKPGPLLVTLDLASAPGGFIYSNETATLTFTMTFVGTPLQNVNVSWLSTGGATFHPPSGKTGPGGSMSTVFTPPTFGRYNVTATAQTPQTGTVVRTLSFVVAEVPAKPTPSLVEQILGYWYYFVAAAAVIVVVLVYLFRLRRKKQRAEIEAGFEVV
jgi:hypothetical protein